jgi:succinyl-CoA synthetase alpha subunit
MPGTVGIASRSGSLSYGAMIDLQARGIGQSTVVGIGGAAIKGTSFVDCLEFFSGDDETAVVVLLGEIGGDDEERAAEYMKSVAYSKPVVALLVGRVAPDGVAMGHAGALTANGVGGYDGKASALRDAGAVVADDLEALAIAVQERVSSA